MHPNRPGDPTAMERRESPGRGKDDINNLLLNYIREGGQKEGTTITSDTAVGCRG